MKLSILTPAFNESANLPSLYARLVATMRALDLEWEWIVVDDHSRDESFAIVSDLAACDPRVRGVRLARNSGSHSAITCALRLARGDAAFIIAADLQDPPETLPLLLERWRSGARVVLATSRTRSGTRAHTGFAALYYWILRHVLGMKEMPPQGADFCLLDRLVIDAFLQTPERNVSVLVLITWLGFRQESVEYDRPPRTAGRSGWTTAKKIELVVNSVTSLSGLPIRACAAAGVALMLAGAAGSLAGIVLLPGLGGGLLLVLSTLIGLAGLQLVALGIVGEYVWRTLDEARRRPAYVIEAVTPIVAEAASLQGR